MTRDEVMKRMILVKGSPYQDRAKAINRRTRGENYIETPEPHHSEHFDDFFDYEEELSEFTPARDTIASDIDRFTDSTTYDSSTITNYMSRSEQTEENNETTSFVVMEKIETEGSKANNIVDSSEDDIVQDKLPFEFIQCNFVKDDGERCKKQAKKNQEFCGIHRRYVEKNKS